MSDRPITKRQAEAVLAKVKKQFAVHDDAVGIGPWLAGPGHETSGYAISWEEGPYEWPYLFTEAEYRDQTRPIAGVFVEPVNDWCLGLYRDEP